MKTIFLFVISTLFLTNFAIGQNRDSILVLSSSFLNLLVNDNSEEAFNFFAEETKVGPLRTHDGLSTIWKQLEKQFGQFESSESPKVKIVEDQVLSEQILRFQNSSLLLSLAFNENLKIKGIFFSPYNESQLELVKNEDIWEEQVSVETGKKIKLNGIITYPYQDQEYPAIVLVHGSGPQDMNLSYGPNQLFKELAHALAAKGIVVLRFDKRTKTYAGQPELDYENLTIQEETIDDAISAVKLLKKNKRVNHQKIYILGHSLGGMCAPLIAKQGKKKVAGIIIMAGNARPLEELIQEQFEYLSEIDGKIDKEEQEMLNDLKSARIVLAELKKTGQTEGILPLNLPASYWNSILNYNQITTAINIKQPILILQGERDYQVTMSDYNLWQSSLSSKKNVNFILYPKLNHLLQEGDTKSIPDEYLRRSTLPKYIVNDISDWIKKHE